MSKLSCRCASAVSAVLLGGMSPAVAQIGHVDPEPFPRPPNIVLIVADDVGWHDVSFHAPEVHSPALDRLVTEGVTLERFYASPVCSPTRQALLTGRYPIRWGMERHVFKPWEERGLPRTEEILPEMLRAGTYGPALVTGKWHLGHAYSKFHPLNQGFTQYLGNYNGAEDYYTHRREGERDWKLGFVSRPEDDGIYHTDLLGDQAVQFIAQNALSLAPFFLYVPFLAAHTPNQAPPADVQFYLNQGITEPRATHLAQITVMDRQIGRILDELDARNLTRNTVVWFLSDNGGLVAAGADNGPLRAGKGTVYDGGIRVPSVVRYPNGNLPEGTESHALISHVDVLPTLRGIVLGAGGKLDPPQNPLDGQDMYGVLRGIAPGGDKEHYNFFSKSNNGKEDLAITTFAGGQMSWKLVWRNADFELPPPPAALIELYDLSTDSTESMNVAGGNPTVVNDLLQKLEVYRDLRPEDGSGFEGTAKPPGWVARPEWEFIDQPTVCDERYIVYRTSAASTFQEIGVVNANGTLTSFGTTANGPDGFDGLRLQGIGRNPVDGLLHGVTIGGGELYQIDDAGLVMKLGPISGLPGVALHGGDVQPNGSHLFVFDNGGDRLFKIALASLAAKEVTLSGDVPPGNLQITDLAFASTGNMLAYDATSQRVLTITKAGAVSQSAFTFPLGTNGAVWVDENDDLYAYKRNNDGLALGPGLYRLELSTGALVPIGAGPQVWSIDGGGCVSVP